jgi:hypothetical protein
MGALGQLRAGGARGAAKGTEGVPCVTGMPHIRLTYK